MGGVGGKHGVGIVIKDEMLMHAEECKKVNPNSNWVRMNDIRKWEIGFGEFINIV